MTNKKQYYALDDIGFIGIQGRSEKQVKKDIKNMAHYIKLMKSGKPLPTSLKKKLVKAN